MRKLLWTFITAGAVASGVGVAACGDDDNSAASPGTPDGGPIGQSEAGPNPGVDGGGDGGPLACSFQSFVVDLIDNHTTAKELPTADLGGSCPDDHTGTAFAKYFP